MTQGELKQRRTWRRSALAAAGLLALMGASLDAQALVLGAVSMRSALGEPLRAEIEVPQISADEASSLQAAVATADTFRAIGVQYAPVLAGARVTLHRRASGQAYLRIAADQPAHEPVLSIVIEASWAGGHIVRNYTMLVDPPGGGGAAPVLVTPPRVAAPVAMPAVPEPQPAPAVVRAPAGAGMATAPLQVHPAPPREPAVPAAPVATPRPQAIAADSDGPQQVTVRRGDTAFRIVSAHAQEGVSLDQMLVALLQANPSAFIKGNVNRMKAGAVLTIPTAEQAGAVPQATARRALLAHSRDFQAYRRSLAQSARAAPPAAAGRSDAGSVQAEVRDASAPAPSEDRLTLSRAAQPTDQESALAQAREQQEQSEQVARLNQNISDLARLQTAAVTMPEPAAAPAPASLASEVPAGSEAPAANDAPAASEAAAASAPAGDAPAGDAEAAGPGTETASAPAEADAATTTATTATAPAADAAKEPAPAAASDASLLDSLPGYPQLLWAGAGLLALLAAGGLLRARRRKREAEVSKHPFLAPLDRPAGRDAPRDASTVVDRRADAGPAAEEPAPEAPPVVPQVNPAAAAAAILAQDREADAEQLLKDAIRAERGRVPNHRKLADLYAKRGDALALEAIAVEAYDITQGEGEDWQEIARLGHQLDPNNKLYLLGGSSLAAAAMQAATEMPPLPAGKTLDELYISLDLDVEPEAAPAPPEPAPEPAPPASPAPLDFELDLDFAPDTDAAPASTPQPASGSLPPGYDFGYIDFALDDDFPSATGTPSAAAGTAGTPAPLQDALLARLEQARQHQVLGEPEAARRLLAELVAEASGPVRTEAEQLLARLG